MMAKSVPRSQHPRPDFERSDWVNLNGEWQFEIDPGNSGEARGLSTGKKLRDSIVVPFCPESSLSGVGTLDFMDAVWYRKQVTLPKAWQGRRVLLHVGACDYEATVWVNGVEIGRHRGGYVQFSFDITPALQSGRNEIVIRAVDLVRTKLQPSGKQSQRHESYGCLYRRTTGIWQTVWLEAVGDAWLDRVTITPDLDSGRVVVQADAQGPPATLRAVVRAGRRIVAETEAPVAWRNTFAVLDVPDVRAWSPTDPFLYSLELSVSRKGKELDRVSSYFGFRKVAIDGNKFLLNGEVLFQRLVLDQGFYPKGIYTARTDRELKRDIALSMAMGFNGARLHQKVFEPRFLYWADRMGYLVWGEFPDWGLDFSSSEALENHASEWVEELQRDRNHPSVIGWCPTNETPESERRAAIAHIYRLTRAIDPSRPVIDTSGYTHVVTDFDDNHDYTQDPVEFAKRQDPLRKGKPYRNHATDADYAGQPFMCSEYGGIWWNPGQTGGKAWGYGDRPRTRKEFLGRLKGLTDVLMDNPCMAGLCYTQLTDVEQEVNGLYTFDRKPKFPAELIAPIFKRKAAIEK
ncbi:MAG: beta-galactosidase [bacterium]|nr:beta-galactosidase [bacterium]